MFKMMVVTLVAVAAIGGVQDAGIPADARAAIAAANSAWLPAMKARDATAIAEPYAEDGVFVTPTGVVATGRDGVARLMRERFAQRGVVTSGELVQDGMTRQGAMIYEWGHATVTTGRAGARSTQSRGRYLTVWRQNGSGRWEIIRNLSLAD